MGGIATASMTSFRASLATPNRWQNNAPEYSSATNRTIDSTITIQVRSDARNACPQCGQSSCRMRENLSHCQNEQACWLQTSITYSS